MEDRVRRINGGELGSMPLSRKRIALLTMLFLTLLIGAGSVRRVGFVTRAAAAELGNNEQDTEASRRVEAALKDLGARIERDGDEVVYVSLWDNKQITDADLVYLTNLPWRKTRTEVEFRTGYGNGPWPAPALHLAGTEITDAGLLHLKGLTTLRLLWLSTEITDAGLAHLKGLGLTSLETLVLNGTEITDAGLVHLMGLNNLTDLDLQGTEVSDEGISKLKEALPNCKIKFP